MKHYLVDTNVVIDMLLNRDGADAACAVIDGAERGEYALRKMLSHEERISALIQLQEVLHVLPVDAGIINTALCSGWIDFEDAVQNFTAVADNRITGIITRNTKDFQKSKLDIIDSLNFVK